MLGRWFEEKRRRFLDDFPTLHPPKAVLKAGEEARQAWLLVSCAPEQYYSSILEGGGQARGASAGAGGGPGSGSDLTDPLIADQ